MSREGPPGRPEMVAVRCPRCSGQGTVKQGGESKTCPTCNGSGQIKTR